MYFIILRTYEQHKLGNISKRKMKCLTLNNRLIPGINTGWLRLVVGKWGFWDIDLGNFRKLGQFSFLNLNLAEKPKNKRKKYKN